MQFVTMSATAERPMSDPERGSLPPLPRRWGGRTPLTDEDELQLRREYGRLPKGSLRWASSEGQLFLKQLSARVDAHGAGRVCEALSITREGLRLMLERLKPDLDWGDELPSAAEIGALVRIWEDAKRHRADGNRVARGTALYYRLHTALMPLVDRHSTATIAAVTKIPKRDVDRFLSPPDMNALRRSQLGELTLCYANLRPGSIERGSPAGRTFLTQLRITVAFASPLQIARTLEVDVERVRGWLRIHERQGIRR
jgi:hypothetical protein